MLNICANLAEFMSFIFFVQVKNDYLKIDKPIAQDLAIQLCCLEIRRFFKDITQFALDKKSNFEYLEKDVGLHNFLPSPVLSSIKVSKLSFKLNLR